MLVALFLVFRSVVSFAPEAVADPSYEETAFVVLLNRFRTSLHLHPLVSDDRLVDAARNHAYFMSNYHVLTHYGPKPWWGAAIRMRAAGIPSGFLTGENIARGNFNAKETFIQWFFSEEHLQAMLTDEYDHIGVAREGCESNVDRGSCFWVTDFAQLQPQSQLSNEEPTRAAVLKAAENLVGLFDADERDAFLNYGIVPVDPSATPTPAPRRGIFKYFPHGLD